MSYKVIEKKSGQIKLEIEAAKDELLKFTSLVSEELSKNLKIDGFRPGKAPLFMVQKEVGEDNFWAEVIDKVVPEAYLTALVKEGITPIGAPAIKVTQFVPGEKLVFEAEVPVLPEIKNLVYKDLKIKEEKSVVTKKDIEEATSVLLERSKTETEVDRAAKNGDKVEIDFTGTLKGLPFDGNESKNHPIILGSKTFVPGFEEKIEGKKPGEEFEINITFPKDYHAKNLAGQEVQFKVKLNKVIELTTPKATDEWAKEVGFENLKSLEEEIKKQLTVDKEIEAKRKTEEEIINKIIEKNKFEAPDLLVEEEVHRMIHEAEHNLSHSGLTIDKFLEMTNKTLGDLEKEMKPEAEKRVKIGVVLGEVARLEKLTADEKEVDAEIEKIIEASSGEKEDVRAFYETPERKKEIGNQMVVREVLNKLWKYNVVKS